MNKNTTDNEPIEFVPTNKVYGLVNEGKINYLHERAVVLDEEGSVVKKDKDLIIPL